MKFYKIQHLPSGLFYKPSKYGSKSNLSKKGKVYPTKPTLRYLGNLYHHPLPIDRSKSRWSQPEYENRKVIEEEWKIIEYTAT